MNETDWDLGKEVANSGTLPCQIPLLPSLMNERELFYYWLTWLSLFLLVTVTRLCVFASSPYTLIRYSLAGYDIPLPDTIFPCRMELSKKRWMSQNSQSILNSRLKMNETWQCLKSGIGKKRDSSTCPSTLSIPYWFLNSLFFVSGLVAAAARLFIHTLL